MRMRVAFAILLFSTTACSEPAAPRLVSNEKTREAARACGFYEGTIAIGSLESEDRPTMVVLKQRADSQPESWRCLQEWGAKNGYGIAYRVEFN